MKLCKIDGCEKIIRARGLCSTHYSQLRRTGSPLGVKLSDSQEFIPHQPRNDCSIEGCNNPHFSRSWCSMHYQRWEAHGDPEKVIERGLSKEKCSKCGINERRKSATTGKIHSWCQSCLNEASRQWNAREAGPRWRRYKLKKTDIQAMKEAQNNLCGICGDSFDIVSDHVDHDNRCCPQKTSVDITCGKCIRSLLCSSCNQGLGNFKDNVQRLQLAIDYLNKWNEVIIVS